MALAALIVRIGADVTGLNKGLTDADREVQRVGKKLTKLGSSLTKGLTTPIVGAGVAFGAAAVNVGRFADSLLDLVDQTGLSSGVLQEFRHVAAMAGVESDTLAIAAIKLTTAMSSGDEQSKQLSDALARLGLSATDSAGNLVSMDTLLPSIVGKLQGVTDTTMRNTLAADIFGKSWAEMAPILALSADEMGRARQEAHDLGMVLSEEALAEADEFRRGLDKLTGSMGGVVREIGMAAMPVMQSLVGILQGGVVPVVRSVVGWFADLSPAVKITIGVIAGLAAAAGPLILVFGTIMKFLPLLKVGFAILTGPIGLTIAAVAALTAAGIQLVRHWDWVKFRFTLVWAAIKDAVFSGVEAVLGALVKMVGWIPVVGDKVRALQSDFQRFAEDSLAKSGRAMAEFEAASTPVVAVLAAVQTGANGAATGVTVLNAAMKEATAEAKKLAATMESIGTQTMGKMPSVDIAAFLERQRNKGINPIQAGAADAVNSRALVQNLSNQVKTQIGAGADRSLFDRMKGMFAGSKFGANDSLGTKVGQVLQAGGGGGEMGQMVQAFAAFGPLASILPVITGALETIGPVFTALLEPLKEIGRIVGQILGPPLKLVADLLAVALAPALKFLSAVARVVTVAISYFAEALGSIIKFIGKLIDSLPFVSAKGIIRQGQAMIDAAKAARRNTDATEKATDAIEKFAGALSNIPRVLNVNALQHMVTGAGGGGGAGSGGGSRRVPPERPLYNNYGNVYITVPGSGDPERTAAAVGSVVERKLLRGGTSRISLTSLATA